MPTRLIVAKELSEIFKLIAHPDRIRLIEELRKEECDVNTLADRLDLPGPRVSQHLALLRAHRLVEERRDGRHHFYHLTQPEIAQWIVAGLDFIEGRLSGVSPSAIRSARELWSAPTGDEA
ncbi:MAG: metalloregulator ArsR/SmtB family transcription factor [Pseudomonadota bacterium]